MQTHLLAFLRMRGYASVLATSANEAFESLTHRSFRFTLLDLDLDGVDASEFIQRLKLQGGDAGPVIGFSSGTNGRHESDPALLAADAFLNTPLAYGDLDRAIADILVSPQRSDAQAPGPASGAIRQEIELWQSAKMREVRDIINEAADVDVTVLITGETGTGKEVVAHAIHHLSTRRGNPFVKVNCAAVPRELLESELFGHERGAFTGAHKLKIGKFEAAHYGMIFLDEIGDLPELENLVQRMILPRDPLLTRTSVPHSGPDLGGNGPSKVPAPEICLKDISRKASLAAEREVIASVLGQTGGNRVRAAKALKISYRALLYKIKRVGLANNRPSSPHAGAGQGAEP